MITNILIGLVCLIAGYAIGRNYPGKFKEVDKIVDKASEFYYKIKQ